MKKIENRASSGLEHAQKWKFELEHEKILLDRAFDWKCTIFAKMCLFLKASLHQALKNWASSGLEHAQKWKFEHWACLGIKNWLRMGIFQDRVFSGATLVISTYSTSILWMEMMILLSLGKKMLEKFPGFLSHNHFVHFTMPLSSLDLTLGCI